MSDDIDWARTKGRLFGMAVWAAIAAGAAILSAAGAPNLLVGLFAAIAVAGFVVLGVRVTKQR